MIWTNNLPGLNLNLTEQSNASVKHDTVLFSSEGLAQRCSEGTPIDLYLYTGPWGANPKDDSEKDIYSYPA